MDLTISTPALLFPAISVLVLAYTNRFVAISRLTRELHEKYQEDPQELLHAQLRTLRKRIVLIRNMQAIGITGFLFCIICMFMIFLNQTIIAEILFVCSLVLLATSLTISLMEIFISGHVLMLQLNQDIEAKERLYKIKK